MVRRDKETGGKKVHLFRCIFFYIISFRENRKPGRFPLQKSLQLLRKLQEVDLKIIELEQNKKALPRRLLEIDEKIASARRAVEEESEQVEALHKARRDKETNLQEKSDMIIKIKARIPEIKTNKEYQAVLKEIESYEELKSKIEDEIIETLEEADRLEHMLDKRRNWLKENEAIFNKERAAIEAELPTLDDRLNAERSAREDLIRQIDPKLINKYETIRTCRGGIAVTTADKGICQGCNMNIPPQLYNEILRIESVIQCPSCKRILSIPD